MNLINLDYKIYLLKDVFFQNNGAELFIIKLDNSDEIYKLSGLEKEVFHEFESGQAKTGVIKKIANKHYYNPKELESFINKLTCKLEAYGLIKIS